MSLKKETDVKNHKYVPYSLLTYGVSKMVCPFSASLLFLAVSQFINRGFIIISAAPQNMLSREFLYGDML